MLAYLPMSWLNKGIVENYDNSEDAEIKRVRKFSPSTLIEMPEMSHAQELLNTPIPFANRIERLSSMEEQTSEPVTIRRLREKLKVSQRFLAELIVELQPSVVDETTTGEAVYERYTLEVFEDELEWSKSFDTLDDYLTITAISEYLDRSYDWVMQQAYELAVYPRPHVNSQGKEVLVYPKSTAWMLRIITLHSPPANDWYSRDELENLLGKTREWIVPRLAEAGILSAMRTSAERRIVIPHYPPESLDVLKDIVENQKPAGDWLPVWEIAQQLEKHVDWVNARIKQYEHESELRLDSILREHKHYPPRIVDILRGELAVQKPAEDWMTQYTMSRILGKHNDWVGRRIQQFEHHAETRVDTSNQERIHYPPHVFEYLQSLLNKS
jgi:hypothetical protein